MSRWWWTDDEPAFENRWGQHQAAIQNAVVAAAATPRTIAERFTRDLVQVVTKDGQTIHGVLSDSLNDGIVLTAAYYVGRQNDPLGDVAIYESNISFLTRLTAEETTT